MAGKSASFPIICTIDKNLILEIKKKDKNESILHNGKYELSLTTQLDLHLKEEDGQEVRKIRTIENLVDLVPNLEHLSLSYNAITKIQGLNGLDKLISLNLAENDIEVLNINALASLRSLERLNVSGNKIKRIPSDIYRLSLLTDLRLARNKLEVLKDINHLVNLPYLRDLTTEENKFCDEEGYRVPSKDYRVYTIFMLTTLEKLDGDIVSNKQRNAAKDAFASEHHHVETLPAPVSPAAPQPVQHRSYSAAFTPPVRPHSPSLLVPQSATKAMNESQQRIEKLTAKLVAADQENKTLQTKLDQMIIMSKHAADTSAEVLEWKFKCEQCEAKLNECLSREEQTKASLTLELAIAKEEIDKQVLLTKKFEMENNELRELNARTMDEIVNLRSNILNSNIGITKEAVKSLSSIDDWKGYVNRMDIAAHRTENEELRAFNGRLQSEMNELLSQLSESNSKVTEARNEIEELKLKINMMNEATTAHRLEISDLKEKDRKSTVALQRLRENKNTLENERIHYKILSEQLEADMTTYLNAASQKKVTTTPRKLTTATSLLDQRIFPQQQQLNQRLKTPTKPKTESGGVNASFLEVTSSTDSEGFDAPNDQTLRASRSRIQQPSIQNQSVLAPTPVKLKLSTLEQAAAESMAHMLVEEIYLTSHNSKSSTAGPTGEYVHDSCLREACARAALRLVHNSANLAKSNANKEQNNSVVANEVATPKKRANRKANKLSASIASETQPFVPTPFEMLGSREYLSQLVTETQAGIAAIEDSNSLKAEIRELEKIVREKEIKIETMQQEVSNKEDLLANLKRVCDEYKSKANETLDELSLHAKRLQSGRDEMIKIESDCALVKRELDITNSNLKDSRAMSKIETKNLSSIQARVMELKEQQKSLEEQSLQNKELIMKDEEKLRHSKGLANEQLRQLQADFHRLQSDFKAKQRGIEDLDKQRRFMEDELEIRRRDAESLLSTTTRQYEEECRKINSVKEEIGVINIERDQLNGRRRQLESELSHMKDSLSSVSSRYEAEEMEAKRKLENYERKLQDYEKKIRVLKGELVRLETEQGTLRNGVEEYRRQQNDLERSIDARRRVADEELSQLQNQMQLVLRDTNQKKADLDHSRAELESLSSELHTMERRYESVKRSVHEQEMLIDSRRETLKGLDSQLDRGRLDSTSLKKTEDNLQHQLQLLKSEIDNNRRQLEEGKRKLNLLTEEEASMKDSQLKLRNGVAQARKDLEDSQSKLDHINSQCEREKRELMDIRTKKSVVEADLHRCDEELKCSQLRNNDENIRKVELEAALTKSTHDMNRTTREIVLLDKQLGDSKRLEEDLKRREQELRISLEKIRVESENQKADLQHERITVEKLQDEHRTLIVEIRKATEENRRVQQELGKYQNGLDHAKAEQLHLDRQKEDLNSEIHDLREKGRLEMLRTDRLEKNVGGVETRLQQLRDEMQKRETENEKIRTISDEERRSYELQKNLLRNAMEELSRIEQSIADANRQLNEERHRAVSEISYLNQAKQSANAHVLQVKETQKRQERTGSVVIPASIPSNVNYGSVSSAEKVRATAVGLSDVFPSIETANALVGVNHKPLASSNSSSSTVVPSSSSVVPPPAQTTSVRRSSLAASSEVVPVILSGNSLPTVLLTASNNAFTTLQQELEALNKLSSSAEKSLAAYA